MKTQYGGINFISARHLLTGCLLLGFAMTAHAVDNGKPAEPLTGRLTFIGSDTLSNLMSYWAAAFSAHNPSVSITLADPGGVAGIDALINETADLALTSSPFSSEQVEAFVSRFGYPPRVIPVAMDAVALYVNDANPLTSIAIPELDAVFSSTYRCGEPQPINTWGGLGVQGSLAKQRITAYGLTVDSGANSLFREVALCGGDYSQEFQALAGPEAVQSAIMTDPASIGYFSSSSRPISVCNTASAPGAVHNDLCDHLTDKGAHRPITGDKPLVGFHALALAAHKGAAAIAPTADAIRSGRYPMSRTLAITLNHPENRPLSPALQAFIDFVLSPVGQAIVAKAGYVSRLD